MKIVKIGRALDNDFVIDDATVSKYHCHIVKNDDNTYEIFDDKSKNGIYVNGWKITGRKILSIKDKVRIGKTILELSKCFKLFNSQEEPIVSPPGNDAPPSINHPSSLPMDLDVYMSKIKHIEAELHTFIIELSTILSDTDTPYKKIFDTSEEKKKYYIGEYTSKTTLLKTIVDSITSKSKELQSFYEGDFISGVLQSYQWSDTEKDREIIEQAHQISKKYKTLKSLVHSEIEKCCTQIDAYYSSYFNQQYDTSAVNTPLWEQIQLRKNQIPSTFFVGCKEERYDIFDETITIPEKYFVELLNKQHVAFHYGDTSKSQALHAVNTLIGRMMAAVAPGKLLITMVDADEMDGTCDIFKCINRDICQILVRPDEIRRSMDETDRHIGNIIQNLLLSPIDSLFEYNQNKENKEAYHLLVIEDYPSGIGNESQYLLEHIMKNGIRAGVNVLLLINEDKINRLPDREKVATNIENLEKLCEVISINKIDNIRLEILSDQQLHGLVQYVNSEIEIQDEESVLFADYLLPEEEWWNRRSAKYIEVPFGISVDKQIQHLRITQESGQNSAVVIGIPGSGKSVFLHTLICNAVINYSPDELNLYLIDFSGVEFNSYALHNLPHARVIAPEAEREFGLSILAELVEEGSRRMNLCREYDVSNIVDLKAKNPSLHVPRLLVIIDEFQKFFEIENDIISRDANAKIHTIIQEFRKFGINLILATQKLPSSSVLPKDLIANRIVFKSAPADFSSLISLANNTKMPQLRTGECIYNSESGSPYDNNQVQGFLITKHDIDRLLPRIAEYGERQKYVVSHKLLVFRGTDLPNLSKKRVAVHHRTLSENPTEVGIYFGESIAINETDIYAGLRKESGNNILILGGEPHVAQRIAFYASLSATMAHTDESALFFTFNFMRSDDPLREEVISVLTNIPFSSQIVSKQEDVIEILSAIKEEIEVRNSEETREQTHIYLTIFSFQLARMFDRGGRRGDDVSECGTMLEYILRHGPSVGVFTILQVDNWDNLTRIGNPLSYFTYRIALQMTENDSNKIINSSAANKLFVFNRPSSVYRAYFRDNNKNITIKFKPYK